MSDTNTQQQKTVYVNKSMAKARDTKIGQVINLSFDVKELGACAKEFKNEKGYLNLSIIPRKTVGQYGDTHSITVDLWKPDPSRVQNQTAAAPATKAPAKKVPSVAVEDECPF